MATLRDVTGRTGLMTDGDWILTENMDPNGSIGVVQLKHIGVGEFLHKNNKFINEATFKELGCTEVMPGDILISRMADPIARACIMPTLSFRCVTAVDVAILRVDNTVADASYIRFLCNSATFRQQAERAVRGTTRARITRKELANLEFPLPSLPIQKHTASVLGRADRLRRHHSYILELSDAYLQSVFLDMFGNPISNPKGFPIVKFEDIFDSRLGKMLDAKQQTGKHLRPYLRNANVQWGRFNLSDIHYMDFDENDRNKFRLCKGDVIICEGGEVGRSAIWNKELTECYYQKALHCVRPKPDLATSEFLVWLMWSLAKLGGLKDFTSQATIAHLTGVKLKSIEFPLPPLPLQKKYSHLAHQFERLHAQQREAERQAEHLFQTLLHRAFHGELREADFTAV